MRIVISIIVFAFSLNISFGQITYYSYQSGSWSLNTTWTTDPSGTLWTGGAVPGINDHVVILNGRTIKINENSKQVNSLLISYGGIIDLQATITHNFGVVSGQGLLRSHSASFPGGNFSDFVSATGGTIEYYDLNGTLPMPVSPANTFNHLKLTKEDATASVYTLTLASSLIVNGDLVLSNSQNTGTNVLTIGNSNTARSITVAGNVQNDLGCSIEVGNFNVVHNVVLYGDLVNSGKIDFNNNAANAVNTLGAAKVTFKGATNNTVSINANTTFYDFAIDKGVDQSPVLEVYSNAPVAPFEGNWSSGYSINLISGTLKLGTYISAPKVSSGSNYDISINSDNKAGLWLSSNASMVFVGPVVVYGKLHVSESASLSGASVIVTRESGEIEIEGGTVTTGQFRPSTVVTATPRGSFTMTGGTFNVTGPSHDTSLAIFDWHYVNTSFKMSGGTINITSPNSVGAFHVESANYEITGGDINVTIPAANDALIYCTVPIWNLNILKPAVSTKNAKLLVPLTVLNNLNLTAGNNPVLDANGQSLYLAGNFNLPVGTTYTPNSNTTFFKGSGGQVFTNLGTITGGLYNLTLENTSNLTISQNLAVSQNLTVNASCFLNDNGKIIQADGNVYNSGTHISQANGGIVLAGTGSQDIGGAGTGIFGNLIVDKTAGSATLSVKQKVEGNLRLANGILDLSRFNLVLGANAAVYDGLSGTGTAFGATKMVRTAGNPSDGGLSKIFNATGSFVFPVGTGVDYAPATIQINAAPSAWGTISVKPVLQNNPLVTSTNSLNYYWKVTSSGFTGLASGSVSHSYHYSDAALTGRGIESNYIPSVFRPNSWAIINDISKVIDVSNDVLFNNTDAIDGEYTAGEPDAFQSVKVFYSRQSGNWNDYLTWSTDSAGGNPVPDPAPGPLVAGIHIPGPNNPAVIGNGVAKNYTVTIPSTFSGVIVGNLQVNQGSVLDITTSTGHNFGYIPDTKISGTGKLRISSNIATAVFPGGDFGNFLSEGGGTVEYYSTGTTNFIIPPITITARYNNLVLSPSSGRTITMPSGDVTIFNNFETDGAGTAQLNSATSKTLTIHNNLSVKQGTLRFMNNGQPQNIIVEGDLSIASGAFFNVITSSNAVNTLLINGNLVNNGTFDMYGNSANAVCDVTFGGNATKSISGSATLTEFNYLTVNKGTSRNTVLDATIDKLTLSGSGNALRLTNGTFRISNAALSFTLSTNTTFTIPQTGCLSVSYGTANIGTGSDNGDLILAGRLEVINAGIVNIGNGGTFNNDIEYSPSGIPEIVIRDNGTLNVNGQVRRGNTVTGGSLSFTQAGGNLTIGGQNQLTSRGKFEVLNVGSQFNISGGTITIVNGGGDANWFGDLLLTPENSVVSGGTLQLGTASTTSSTFLINTATPLWNIVVDGTTINKIASLRVNPLEVKNQLTINGNSELHANGWDISVGGNFTNNNSSSGAGFNTGGFQPGSATQNITFKGTGSQISGISGNLTNFANLIIASSGTVSLNTDTKLLVSNKLSLTSGILSDGGNTITVTGNVDNAATHQSPVSAGGLLFSGTSAQVISGSGSGKFGNIILNNGNNVNMTDNSEIDGVLTFTLGNLYIDDYLLTLGVNAGIVGSPDINSMILTNGALSDYGVRKMYPAGPADFTFPLGITGKYTPARFNVTAVSSSGYIQTFPVNAKHPNLQDAAGNELSYYWVVSSSGLSNPTVQHIYQYLAGDVTGTETSYLAGRYYQGNWAPVGGVPSGVNSASHFINLMGASGVNYIDGEYTAGATTNFSSIPIYYNRVSGNWENPATWSTDPVLKFAGAAASTPPNGNPVYIAPGNTVTINSDSRFAYSVNIPVTSTLDLKNTVFHSLGHITGGGTLSLTSTSEGMFVMPGGEYDSLLMASTSTVIFHNPNTSVPATLPLKPGNIYKPLQNVIFTGNGTKYLSAEHLKVLGNLTINGGLLSNALYNKNIYISGNWIDNISTSSIAGFLPGKGLVSFEGSNAQTLSVSHANAQESFYNFRIQNAQNLSLTGTVNVKISNLLYLSSGNINTNATNTLTLTNVSPSVVSGGGTGSFVNGPLRKNIVNGSYFNFPVGSSARYGNIYLSSVSQAGTVEAEFYNNNPTLAGMPVSNKILPIDTVNNYKYWRTNASAGTQGNVRIGWDAADISSGFIPGTLSARNKIRVVRWTGTDWQNQGNLVSDGAKTVQTTSAFSLAGDTYFGLGIESLPTATITSGSTSICDDGSSDVIQVNLTGIAPWTIRYKVNGSHETTISNIGSTPYSLVVSNAISPLNTGPGVYTFTLSYVLGGTGASGIKDFTKSFAVTLNESPNPVISGNTTVPGGQTAVYSTPNLPGHTYVWTVSGGSITAGQSTNQITVTWGAGPTGTVRVKETVTTGGCSKTTGLYNVNITDIPNPVVTGNNTVCDGSASENYSTPLVGTHTYVWTVTGGTITSGQNTHQIAVAWTTAGSGSVKVEETGSATVSKTLNVTVNPLPSAINTVIYPTICKGDAANVIVQAAPAGITYQLYRTSDNSAQGLPISSGPGGDVTLTVSPAISTLYYIIASNEYNCAAQLTNGGTITVNPLPATGSVYRKPNM